MEVQVLVTVQIALDEEDAGDPASGDPLEGRMQESAVEAIQNALALVEASGFSHDMAKIASVSVVSVELCPLLLF